MPSFAIFAASVYTSQDPPSLLLQLPLHGRTWLFQGALKHSGLPLGCPISYFVSRSTILQQQWPRPQDPRLHECFLDETHLSAGNLVRIVKGAFLLKWTYLDVVTRVMKSGFGDNLFNQMTLLPEPTVGHRSRQTP